MKNGVISKRIALMCVALLIVSLTFLAGCGTKDTVIIGGADGPTGIFVTDGPVDEGDNDPAGDENGANDPDSGAADDNAAASDNDGSAGDPNAANADKTANADKPAAAGNTVSAGKDSTAGETTGKASGSIETEAGSGAPATEDSGSGAAGTDSVTSSSGTGTCTITITCKTLLANMDSLKEEKRALVPADGVILQPTEVTFSEGDSAFDVLLKTVMDKGIHMDYNMVPAYKSAYIKGINNLYEFDCGSLSGWQYAVNGVSPNYGTSGYVVSDGDSILFWYTCALGKDYDMAV